MSWCLLLISYVFLNMKHLWDTFKIEEFNLVNIRMRVRLSKNSLQTVDEVIGWLCNWTNNSDNWVTQITQLWFGNYLNVCCARLLMISGDGAGMAVPVTRQTLKKCNFRMVKSFEQSKIEMNQFLIEWHLKRASHSRRQYINHSSIPTPPLKLETILFP